jgi:hypothetical protein
MSYYLNESSLEPKICHNQQVWFEMMGNLDLTPKPLLLKIWKIVTWRWRLQLAINAPFGVLWLADKTNPAVHQFDMSLLTAMHAEWMAPMIGIG